MPRYDDFHDLAEHFPRVKRMPRRQKAAVHCAQSFAPAPSRWSAAGSKVAGHRERPESPSEVLIGDVLSVPNSMWGFDDPGSKDHPGVCARDNLPANPLPFLKGTDARNIKPQYRTRYLLVDSSRENGLTKPTGFHLKLHDLAFSRVRLLYPERHLGVFARDDLVRLQTELAHLYRNSGASG